MPRLWRGVSPSLANGANFSRIKCWSKIGVALIRPSGTGMYAAFSRGEKAVSAAICHRHTCRPRPLGVGGFLPGGWVQPRVRVVTGIC
jgi:hypothetical protein